MTLKHLYTKGKDMLKRILILASMMLTLSASATDYRIATSGAEGTPVIFRVYGSSAWQDIWKVPYATDTLEIMKDVKINGSLWTTGYTDMDLGFSAGDDSNINGELRIHGYPMAWNPQLEGSLVWGNGGSLLTHTSGVQGYYNTAVGHTSGLNITTGYRNTSVGYQSMWTTGEGAGNTAVGSDSLANNGDGNNNIAIGYSAAAYITGGVVPNITTDNGIYVGNLTRPSADNNTNEIAIGTGVTGKGSNTAVIGDSSVTDVWMSADGGAVVHGAVTDLKSATTIIGISSATAPTVGQVLTASNGTTASWQDPTGALADALTIQGGMYTPGTPESGPFSVMHSNTLYTHNSSADIVMNPFVFQSRIAGTSDAYPTMNTLSVYSQIEPTSTTTASAYAAFFSAENLSTVGSVGEVGSVAITAYHRGSGTIGRARGSSTYVGTKPGATGTITHATGQYVHLESYTNSAITNGNGILVDAPFVQNNTTANYTGILMPYIPDTSVANRSYILLGTSTYPVGEWTLYSADTHPSYFAGSTTFNAGIKLGGTAGSQVEMTRAAADRYFLFNATGVSAGDAFRIHNYSHPLGFTTIPEGNNLFMGSGSGNFTTGSTATNSMHSSRNVGIGHNTLKDVRLGFENVAIGNRAMEANLDAPENVAIGAEALMTMTDGTSNTAVGEWALRLSNGGQYNTAMGAYAGTTLAGGDRNTIIGSSAMELAESGSDNSALGMHSLFYTVTSSYNTGVGSASGKNVASGLQNYNPVYGTYLGYDTRASVAGNTNETVVGAQAIGKGSNTVVLGDDNVTQVWMSEDGQAALYTDDIHTTSSNTNDIGDTTYYWRNLYIGGDINFLNNNSIQYEGDGVTAIKDPNGTTAQALQIWGDGGTHYLELKADGTTSSIYSYQTNMQFDSGGTITFKPSLTNGSRWEMTTAQFAPISNNAVDLGSSTKGVRNGYFATEVTTPSLDSGASNLLIQYNNGTVATVTSGSLQINGGTLDGTGSAAIHAFKRTLSALADSTAEIPAADTFKYVTTSNFTANRTKLLPAAAAGLEINIVDDDDVSRLTINPASGDVIIWTNGAVVNGSGGGIAFTARYQSVKLLALDATTWIVTSAVDRGTTFNVD
jgi:hypothetical protein